MKELDEIRRRQVEDQIRVRTQVKQIIEEFAIERLPSKGLLVSIIDQKVGKHAIEPRQESIPESQHLLAVIIERAGDLFNQNGLRRGEVGWRIKATSEQFSNRGRINLICLLCAERMLAPVLFNSGGIDDTEL